MKSDEDLHFQAGCARRLMVARLALDYVKFADWIRDLWPDEAEHKRNADRAATWENKTLVPPWFVVELKREFGVTPDFIYADDRSGLPGELRKKIAQVEHELAKQQGSSGVTPQSATRDPPDQPRPFPKRHAGDRRSA